MRIRTIILCGLAATGLLMGASNAGIAAPPPPRPPLNFTEIDTAPLVRVHDRRRNWNGGYYRGRGGFYYYNGHRGYRNYRRGYRRYNGWWFPPGAFSFGFVPGPGFGVPPAYGRGLSPAHYRWCSRRYRSYRPYDNSFQPYHGPRRLCFSPYGP